MATVREALEHEWNVQSEANPFAEVPTAMTSEGGVSGSGAVGFAPWSEDLTPFSEWTGESMASDSEQDRLIEEALEELRDESFDEAVAHLAEETEQTVADRFNDESGAYSAERERFADTHLAPVRFESQQYLEQLESGLQNLDVASLSEAQLDEVLDRLDPQSAELTPAGEEFIGALARKAKKAVKFVAKAAKSVGRIAGSLLGPVLKKLRALINPLLRRVLSFAIGRLPAALQPLARKLATRFTSEAADSEELDALESHPTHLSDVEALVESFDAALAESFSGSPDQSEEEASSAGNDEWGSESRELEVLANARGELIDRLSSATDGEDLAPVVEQFIPALLGALRLGINLVGRPKVVGFLAKYLAQVIRRWVGPAMSGPLSKAIVDTGLRLVALESPGDQETVTRDQEAAPVALASVIEDSVRRFAENEEYVFEDEELTQLASAEAFSQAVSTHFPPRFVRPNLQQAPSLGGTFIARRPRSVRTYRKYSRTPEIEITAQMADALPSFGRTSVGAALRAAGTQLPTRARVHVYQAAPGTTLSRIVSLDRRRGYVPGTAVHPLTTSAAGVLFKEPQLGTNVPRSFLRSRQRIAPGQRFYVLEPTGAAAAALASPTARAMRSRVSPSRAWTRFDARRMQLMIGLHFAETDAQNIAAALRKGQGHMSLVRALVELYGTIDRRSPHARVVREDTEELFEDLTGSIGKRLPLSFLSRLHRHIRRWVLTALAKWARQNAEAFARAAGHPDAGVTVRIRLTAIPGLDAALQGRASAPATIVAQALRGTPAIAITVAPGKQRT